MLREFKFLRRNSGKNLPAEEAENVPVNPKDLRSVPTEGDTTRAPLNAIQDPSQNPNPVQEQDSGPRSKIKIERTPTKGKRKSSDASFPVRTPEKYGAGHSARNRFGWFQKNEPTSNAAEQRDDVRVEVSNSSTQLSRGLGVGNGSMLNMTPRSARTVVRANSGYSESNSTQSTPTKSVSKPPNPGMAAMSGSRLTANGGARAGNFVALSKGVPISSGPSTIINTVEVPQFELKDDPSFWRDHNVQVLIRIRPLNAMEKSMHGYNRCLRQESAQSITWIGQPETRFTFDHVACESVGQETLFRMAGQPMVENCLSGYNSCMFAYGQTGSGKTYTMLGEIEELENEPSRNRGLTPRIFDFLFARIRAEEENHQDERLKYYCKCSFLEIYNEQITDLLDPSCTNLLLREDIKKGVYVENLSEFEVQTVSDILRLLAQGSSNRKVAATNMNRESSRSHSVFTCVIESRWEKDATANLRFARLNLVDLAGSERQKSSGAEGERLREAASINKSLSTLGHVIMVLVDVAHGKLKHVPYRDSRLTFLLQDSLGGNSKTMIIANVSPSICCAAETLNTLKFAQRAKLIQNNAVVNEDTSGDIIALQHQIRLLKEELLVLKREKVSRSLSFGTTASRDMAQMHEDGYTVMRHDVNQQMEDDVLSSKSKCIMRVSSKQLKCLETTLAGALRREQIAEASVKQLEAENEQLNRLVRQREEDARCIKMTLKFREDKIHRMESLLSGCTPADTYLLEENKALSDEIQLLRAKIDRNPEVTRFALENIRLLDQLRRFQDFYEEGEKEILLAEVSDLRDQVLQNLDKSCKNYSNTNFSATDQEVMAIDKENYSIQLELNTTLEELENCRNNLQACLEENAKLRREIDDLHSRLYSIQHEKHDQDGSVTLEKEFFLEIPPSEPNAQKAAQEKRAKKNDETLTKHDEEVVHLQLELDILKVILKEERSANIQKEEMVMCMERDVNLAKEKALLISKECEALKNELNEAKSIIEALESQQILTINEINSLRNSMNNYVELLSEKDLEIISLKKQFCSQRLGDQPPVKYSESEDSPLQAKLKGMQESLEKARGLNLWYQTDQALQASNEEEMDDVRKQAEAETAEVIVSLQEELAALQQQVQDSTLKETQSKNGVLLKSQLKELQEKLFLTSSENQVLGSMLEEKNLELQTLSEEWEQLTSDIYEILVNGHEALEDGSNRLNVISSSFPQSRTWISEQFIRMSWLITEKELVIEELNHCLENVSNSRNDLDCMLRSLKGAATVISEAHQQECSEKENQILMLLSDLSGKTSTIEKLENKLKLVVDYSVRTSHCATAALVIVNRLSDNTNHLKVQKDKDIQLSEAVETNLKKDALLHDQTLTIEEADKQIQNLTMQLEMLEETCAKLRFELLEEQKHVHDLEQKLEGVEENDNILKKTNLDELKSGISMLRLYMTKCVAQLGSREEKTCQSYDCGSASCSSETDSKTNQITKNTHLDLLTSFPNELKCTLEAGKSVCTSAGMSADACDIATSTFVRKEIESFTESFKQVQGEMTGLRYEKEEIRMFEKQSQENMKSLMAEALVLQSAMNSFEKLHRLQLMALDNKLQTVEQAVQKVNTNWSQMKEVLEQEVGDAKIVAAQTAAEASCILGKFEESQETVKEADFMINKLLIANEAMKLEIEKLKTTKITLTDERDALAREVHGLESAYIIKDIQCQEFEKQLVLNLMDTNDLVLELEAFSVHVQASLMKELMSISHEFHCMKSQLVESTKSLRSWLEDIWSESIIKDCSVSVLHLCHMGIMLETVTGLNAENGFLHHGLCESNSVIADLRKRNVRSRKELEMCRIVEGKLLADIKNSFDRITRKEDETGELGIKLTAFEKKITDLQLQEELMLQRSNYMGSQLATLVRELDMSNANALASLLDQEKLMKDKEIMKSETELYIRDLLYNDFQSVIVASRLEEMAVQNAKKEREQIYFSAVLENLQKELIFGGMDAGVKELLSMEKEVEVSLLQSDRQDLLSDLNKSRSNALEMDRVNMGLQNDLDLLKDVACSNQRLEDELSDAVEAKARLSNQVQNLESEYEKLVKEIKMNKMEFDVQNEKLLYNDFQSVIVASQLEEMAVQNAKKEREQIYFSAVLENLQKELIFGSIDAGVKELLLVEKEVEVSLLQSCRQDLLSDLNQSRSNALEMGKVNMGLQNDLDLLKDVACSNQRLEDELSEAVEAKARLSNQVQNLESEYEKLVKEMQMNKMESDVQNEKLQNKICLLEASYSTLQNDMTRSDEKVSRMSCLEAENKSLEDEIAKFEAENHILLQDLVEMKNEVESFLCHFNALSLDRQGLQEEDTSLKTCVASLRTGLDMREAELTELRDQQFALQEELCLKNQDLDIHYNRLNVLIEENASLKSELRSHAKNMHEVLMSLSLNNTKCAGKVNTVHMDTNQTLNVLNEECFTLLDKLLEEGCENLNKASKFIEEFEYFEKFVEELVSRNLLLQTELSRKDEILKGLSFDLRLLQESASNAKDQKDEFDNMASSLEVLEDELALKSGQLVEAVDHGHFLEARLQETLDTIASLELEISNKKERIDVLSFDNQELIAEVKDASAAKQTVQEELTDKRNINDRLELDLISMGNSLEQMHTSIESLNRDLNAVSVERDHLQAEVLILKKELDEAQTRAVESEAIIADAQQMAEARSIYAEEKDKEVKLLEKSVEELECTIDVLESKVDIVKGEAERQRLQREELELELHALKLQLKNVESSDADFKRLLHEKEDNVLGAQKRIQILEREIATRDAEISQCKAHISELYLHAEVQATEYKQKFKALEAMADQVRPEGTAFHVATSSTNKLERNSSKSRGSGSPFKCIGLGLAHQIKSEKDEELTAGRHRIEELEALAASRQKEIFTLNARLAAAESMTHDVIRDLLGVKLDMTNYVSLLNNQQLQKMTDKALIQSTETQAKEQEAHMLRQQLNELIVERQGWLEEINRKQAEMVTLQVSLEELHQRDHLLVAENEMLKVENINQKKKVIELESAIQKLSGQQNLQQRIRHHAKIKEENNLLKIRNEDLGVKLQRAEAILSRVKEELAHYRAANGRCPSIDFDEEQKLHVKLKETEKERLQLEQKLLGLCTSILKAAGITKVIHDVGLPEAEEALNQLNNRVLSLEKEMQDLKLMDRIASEKIRLSELMPQASRLSSGTQDGQQVSKTGSQTPFLSALDR